MFALHLGPINIHEPTGEAAEYSCYCQVIRQSVIWRDMEHGNTEGRKGVMIGQNKDSVVKG